MSGEWIMMIPSIVFTRIKNNFSETIKTKYKMTTANFSSQELTDTPAVFPFVSIVPIRSAEIGRTLDGREKNGVNFAFQVKVTDNASQTRAKTVMTEILRIMSDMGFEVNQIPLPDDDGTIHRYVARFRRDIGASDIL